MEDARPSMPAELKRRVLVEAGHRCAIRTCRHTEVDVHHIVPWRESQAHRYEDLIALCPNCHRKADRGDIDRMSLYKYKELLRDATDRFTQIEVDWLFRNHEVYHSEWYPAYMKIFFERVLAAGYAKMYKGNHVVSVAVQNGIDITPIHFSITDAGRTYVTALKEKGA